MIVFIFTQLKRKLMHTHTHLLYKKINMINIYLYSRVPCAVTFKIYRQLSVIVH